jgi:hypothetical protein
MLNLKNKRVFNLIVYNHNEYSSRLILPQAPFEELFSLKEIENARKNIFALSARYRNISRISKQENGCILQDPSKTQMVKPRTKRKFHVYFHRDLSKTNRN